MTRLIGHLLCATIAALVAYALVAGTSSAASKPDVPPGAKIARDQLAVSHVKPLSEIPYNYYQVCPQISL